MEKLKTLVKEKKRTVQGIIPPMITPLRGRDQLDYAGLERLVEHILAGGVHGLFILGTSGEAPNLSHRLRRELIERVSSQVNDRVPIFVGITDTSFIEAVELAQHAAQCGAAAAVSSTPYYFPTGQEELIEYFEKLVPELPLPLFLYNMPQMTKVELAIDTVRRLLHVEKIIGIKDSSGDINYFRELLQLKRERPDWSVLVGPESLLAETISQGGDGGVNGGANVWPELFVELFHAAEENEVDRVAKLQQQLLQLGQIYSIGRHASAVIKGMKCACSLLGICNDFMAEPFVRFNSPERARVEKVLESLNLLERRRGQLSQLL